MITFPLQFAERLATKIAAELTPFCEQIEIAGSIRRRRPFISDVDLVVLPKRDQVEALHERLLRNSTMIFNGQRNVAVKLRLPACRELQLDVFIAEHATVDMFESTPCTFGSVLLCRTGSKEHNIYLIERAKSLGLMWNPNKGVYSVGSGPNGKVNWLPADTEAGILKALKLDFLPPERRER